MLLQNYRLAEPLNAIEQQVYRTRILQFGNNNASNMRRVILGAAILILLCAQYGTPVKVLLFWACSLLITVAITSSISRHFTAEQATYAQSKTYIKQRLIGGWLIALHYGLAVFLLPSNSGMEPVLMLYAINVMMVMVAIISYSSLPSYYLTFDAAVMLPPLAYVLINFNQHTTIYCVIWLVAHYVYLSRGLAASAATVRAMRTNALLHQEIEEHIITKSKIEHMALHDQLTGLANLRLLTEAGNRNLSIAKRKSSKVGFIFIDINNFKPINDKFGHHMGDEALKLIAQSLLRSTRESDLVARVGGDEFCILISDITSPQEPQLVAQKLRKDLAAHPLLEAEYLAIDASYGCAIFPDDGPDLASIMNRADQRMYQYKRASKRKELAI